MNILALDSSSQAVSVAFVTRSNGQTNIIFQETLHQARFESSSLFTGMLKAKNVAGSPNAVVVGLGPGSYNGLRAGIAAARAFATAMEIPLYAFPSPLAVEGPPDGFWVIGDARGGHYWIACVKEGGFLEKPFLSPSHLATLHMATRPDLPVISSTALDGIPRLHIASPMAGLLATLSENGGPFDGTPEPLYLKPPHITSPRIISSKS